MLIPISFRDISRNADLFYSHFQLRHREFIKRQAYDVKVVDDMEFDEYDTLVSHYLVYSEDGKTVLGCSRLTPVGYGCMLADHFPELVDDKSLFDSQRRIWEGTRFCIDSQLPPEKRREICHALCCGYLEFGLAQGVEQIIGVMQTIILRTVFEQSGVQLNRLGPVLPIGEHTKVQAAAIIVTKAQLASVYERTGLDDVLGYRAKNQARHG